MSRYGLIGAALLVLLTHASAQALAREATEAGLISADISVKMLKDVTQTLSHDSFEGRAPATAGEEKAITYIAHQFALAGLSPGNHGSWFQDVPLVEITPNPATQLHVTGGAKPLNFQYGPDMVAATRRPEASIFVDQSDIIFLGYGINAPENGWNDYRDVDVKGKTVIVLVNDPDWQSASKEGDFGGQAMTYYGRWTYKYEEAARHGAAAVFIVHDDKPASYGWNVVQSSNTGPLLDTERGANGLAPVPVQGWLRLESARQLMAAAGRDLNQLIKAAEQKDFKAVPLGLKASITLNNSVRRQVSRNVIGVLPGNKAPDEHVIYTAHWDHLGQCAADETGDDICNGAQDNATGVAGLVTLAHAASKQGPARRSMVFLAVTAEESGLLGSAYYAEHPIYPLKDAVAGINIDMLNVRGRTKSIVVIGQGKSELEPMLEQWAQHQNRRMEAEPYPERGYFYRSDHFSFARLGVPFLFADAGDDLVDGGIAAGKKLSDAYNAKRYHGPGDEYDPQWNWAGAVEDLQIYYALGRELADGNRWPNWYPSAEFRIARDKMRSTQ